MSNLMPPWPIPPAHLLFAGAVLLAVFRGPARKIVQLAIPLFTLWQVAALHAGLTYTIQFSWMGYQANLLHVDRLRFAFGLIFAIMTVIGSLYALHVEDPLQNAASWIYAGAALGVTFSGDLLAFVLFWELMSVGSMLLVFRRGTVRARKAGTRYVAFHALGGAILVAGVVGWLAQGHDLTIQAIPTDAGWAGWMLLIGIAINAAIPPLGAWLPDAYAEGTVTGAVFLSAFTTKTAVFALLALFPGWKVLLWGGVAMSLYGVLYAVLENNIRRLLAYHIISQVGYMVAGVGMGTAMAMDGSTAHAFSHILYKALLFMGAGAVIYATGKEKLTELGGLTRAMPLALGLYAVGAASISGVPLFNGFISKSIVVSAAGQGGWPWAELLLTLASVGTFFSIGLKLLWFGFVSPKDRQHQTVRPLPRNMYAAMIIGAALCVFFGVVPSALYGWLPFGTEFHPYTVNHVVTSLQLLIMTAFAFWWLLPKLAGKATISIDTDWVYRKLLPAPALALSRGIFAIQQAIGRGVGALTDRAVWFSRNPLRIAERWLGRGVFESEGAQEHDRGYSVDAYRFPVGLAVFAVLLVFGGVAMWHLLQLALGG